MGTLIETKKITELEEIKTVPDASFVPVHDGTGLRKVKFDKFKTAASGGGGLNVEDNAGAHNSIYRGRNLGGEVTAQQIAAIKAGTFDDLFIGDYWEINGNNWRIAEFDYFYNKNNRMHHALIVPDNVTDRNQVMAIHGSRDYNGYFATSDLYKTGLAISKAKVKEAFGDHVLKMRLAWWNYDNTYLTPTEVHLMNERMLYGAPVEANQGKYYDPPVEANQGKYYDPNSVAWKEMKTQLSLFRLNGALTRSDEVYWLTDIAIISNLSDGTKEIFCAYNMGRIYSYNQLAVRPFFCIGEV